MRLSSYNRINFRFVKGQLDRFFMVLATVTISSNTNVKFNLVQSMYLLFRVKLLAAMVVRMASWNKVQEAM